MFGRPMARRIGVVIGGVVVALTLSMGLLHQAGILAGNGFLYRVRVLDTYAEFGLPDAQVTLEVQGLAPLFTTTDSHGRARFAVDRSYVGQTGVLTIHVDRYEAWEQEIEVAQRGLPKIVRVRPIRDP